MTTMHRTIDPDLTIEEAHAGLSTKPGQSYIYAWRAFELLRPFAPHTDQAVVNQLAGYDEDAAVPALLQEVVAEQCTLAKDARGVLKAYSFEPVMTVDKVSRLLVAMLGHDPAEDDRYIGGGYSADDRHDRNLAILASAVDELDTIEETA